MSEDFITMITDALCNINYKMVLFLFLFFIFITSDIFIDKLLTGVNGAVVGRITTTKGSLIQATLLVLFYACMDVLINNNII